VVPITLRNYAALAGALARHTGFGPEMICAHREWNPAERIHPKGIDADEFRRDVAATSRAATCGRTSATPCCSPARTSTS
jgi:hypothetical protein